MIAQSRPAVKEFPAKRFTQRREVAKGRKRREIFGKRGEDHFFPITGHGSRTNDPGGWWKGGAGLASRSRGDRGAIRTAGPCGGRGRSSRRSGGLPRRRRPRAGNAGATARRRRSRGAAIDDEAVDPIDDHLGHAADVAGHDRQATHHRLQQHQPEALLAGEQAEGVHRLVVISQVVTRIDEGVAAGDVCVGQIDQRTTHLPIAHQERLKGGGAARRPR